MFIYFILHHLQGYSGRDLEIGDLLILTCTLQALPFPFWIVLIFKLPILGDAVFIWHEKNRFVLAWAVNFLLLCILHFTKFFCNAWRSFQDVIKREAK